MWLGLPCNATGPCRECGGLTTRTYFEDTYFYGPKAWMLHCAAADGKANPGACPVADGGKGGA